jgi:hypothetical protein
MGTHGQNLADGTDDPDNQKRLQLQTSTIEVRHDRAHYLHNDDREQHAVDSGRGGLGKRLASGSKVLCGAVKDNCRNHHQNYC